MDDGDLNGVPIMTETALREALERSREDVAAGRVYDLEDVLRDLERDTAEMEAANHAPGATALAK